MSQVPVNAKEVGLVRRGFTAAVENLGLFVHMVKEREAHVFGEQAESPIPSDHPTKDCETLKLWELYASAMSSEESPRKPSGSQTANRWLSPFVWMEYRLEQVVQFCKRQALFQILEYAGKLTILISLIIFVWEWPERTRQRLYQQLQTGGAARIEALEGLYLRGERLHGINLDKAYLERVDLGPRDRLERVDLRASSFVNADLQGARLIGADLMRADLRLARLFSAKLMGANLAGADLTRADLASANLSGADLNGAYLIRAHLNGAVLKGAIFDRADLSGEDRKTDLSEAIGLTQTQVDSAFGDEHTVLPEGLVRPKHWTKTRTN